MQYDRHGHLFGNFMQYEVAKSYTAQRLGIDNTPPDDVLDAAKLLAIYCLQPIRDHYGIPFTPTSWYRSEALEKVITVKGFERWMRQNGYNTNVAREIAWQEYFARKSHPKGEAADIEIVGVSNDDLFEWCRENVEYDQLIREFPQPGEPMSGWVHISWRAIGNRGQALEIG